VGRRTFGVDAAAIDRLRAPVARVVHRIGRAFTYDVAQRVEALEHEVRLAEFRARRDLFAAGEREAVRESSELARAIMPGATWFPNPDATLTHALSIAPRGGMALEFGVWSGRTLAMIAADRDGATFGFDSFKGLPETWRSGFEEGTFAVDTVPEVAGAELVVGWFDDTLPGFLEDHHGPVDLLHVDCDLYSSTKTVLEQVGPRLRPGSVIVFDEFFNYPGWREHEYRAWNEFVEDRRVAFTYVGYTIDNEQVVIRLDDA